MEFFCGFDFKIIFKAINVKITTGYMVGNGDLEVVPRWKRMIYSLLEKIVRGNKAITSFPSQKQLLNKFINFFFANFQPRLMAKILAQCCTMFIKYLYIDADPVIEIDGALQCLTLFLLVL